MNPAEQHIFNQPEPYQSIMLYVRSVIKKALPEVEEKYSYRIPFYYYKKKPMVYINRLKGTNFVDVSFMDGNQMKEKFSQLKDYKNRKRVRSIQVRTIEDFEELEFIKILKEASKFIEEKR